MLSAILCAFFKSFVQTVAAKPYLELFASLIASFYELNGITVTTGPKISS